MKRFFLFITVFGMAVGGFAKEAKRDPAVVKNYIRACVGEETIKKIAKHEGGAAFLKKFFGDQDWMEQFAGSGAWSIKPWKGIKEENECAAKALEALDLLVWNDKDDFISSKIGRNIATALALNHGIDWTEEKLVLVMECYREWAKDGTLHDDAWNHDVRAWREVLGFGQNAPLSVENLRWIHDFANVPAERYYGVCWRCAYRLFNCFGASVHGPMYYAPWQHRWNTQELRYRVGGVCGALSKFGSQCAAAHGIRAFTAGQTGHCAFVLWDYTVDRWGIAYSVTGHTGPHDSLGGQGFPALEEIERYYRNPKRMTAEYLRWKGNYEKSMKTCPGNWCAAVSWHCALEAKNASAAEWEAFGAAVRETFRDAPGQGWQLYLSYLDKVKTRDQKLEAAKKGLLAIKENPAKTFESPYWDDLCLKKLDKMFEKDENVVWELFETALEGQAKTPTFYRQTINWGAGRLMNDGPSTKRFLTTVAKSAAKSGAELDYKGMVRKASEAGDIEMFHQVYSLLDKLSPGTAPKANGKSWPKEFNGGQLLSPDGILMTSGTSNWDNPVTYRCALTPTGFEAGNAFHTDKDKAPWGMVKLPGSSDITGVIVVNSGGGQNGPRQVPLRVWTSEDGESFKQVYASETNEGEWKIQLPAPVKAQYVKVGRAPEAKEEVYHLYKILVYGKKLY